MRSRVFRCLVCLLVAAVMIVNLSPLYVHATSTAVTAVAVGVGIVVATAIGLQALGIRQGTDGSAFSSLVSDCAAALSPEWAIDGLITMLSLSTDGITKTYASQGFLQAILDYLFSSEVVSESSISFGYEASGVFAGSTYKVSCSVPFVACSVCFYNGSTYNPMAFLVTEGWPDYYYCNGSQMSYTQATSIGNGYYARSFAQWFGHSDPDAYLTQCSGWYDFGVVNAANMDAFFASISVDDFIGGVSTTQDLTLESVGQKIDTDYDTYVDEGIISVDVGIQFEDDPNTGRNEDDDNNAFWLPAAIPGLNEGIYTDQTQSDAQSGLTDPDIIQQLLDAMNGSGNGSGTGDNTGSENWSPSDMGNFTLDLSRYFPFCIPFDLYDFFTCLNADPVAPVIEWVIPVPGGDTYPLEIDLSPFDPVAQLLRRLQLLLFCVGLAFKTRDLIKG